jgi:selenocysteine-specific elongation factor
VSASGAAPLTVGTAGHIDHGKTALVAALTGVDTDRLPQERERGISIELGFAPLELPGGRTLSLVDVPGHSRFVRTMVAGATGIDLFLLTVAADDGVMPQTREHAEVLRALGVQVGVVAVTKADLADPVLAAEEAIELLGDGVEVVSCSARTGAGVEDVRAALGRAADWVPSRAEEPGPALLHVDRAFTIHGAGSVVTGTLWSGELGVGDTVAILPAGRRARVRGVQVHDAAVERAAAGQRVAVNLSGVPLAEVRRGMAIAAPEAQLAPAWILDAELELHQAPPPSGRVLVNHGTRETPARLVHLGADYWQLRCERPLMARRGDRLVVRSAASPGTLGGGAVVDPRARRHGPSASVVARLERGEEAAGPAPAVAAGVPPAAPPRAEPQPLSPGALELERRLRDAGHEPPLDSELGDLAEHLPALRSAGHAVRLGPAMHAHAEALAAVRARVTELIEAEGGVTLARLRDDLGTSRKYAQALLEHCDAARLTLRLPDDRRVLRRQASA